MLPCAPAPSPITKPSLSLSHGLLAVAGSSLRLLNALHAMKPPMPEGITAASAEPARKRTDVRAQCQRKQLSSSVGLCFVQAAHLLRKRTTAGVSQLSWHILLCCCWRQTSFSMMRQPGCELLAVEHSPSKCASCMYPMPCRVLLYHAVRVSCVINRMRYF